MQKSIVTKIAMVALMLVLVMQFAGCTKDTPSGESTRVVVAQQADAATMDPQAVLDVPSENVHMNIFEGLLFRAEDGSIQPLLAESYTLVDDSTWEFALRQGVEFHNGEPFTADSVKFTLERICDPDNGLPGTRYYSMITEVKVIDSHTVQIITENPYPLLLELLLRPEARMLPPVYVQENGVSELAVKPVGTGPFVFDDWVRDERVVMKANENYWGDGPYVDELVFRAIPDATTRVTELTSGGVHIVAGLSEEDTLRLQGEAGITVKQTRTNRVIFLGFMHDKEPMDNPLVRKAILYAIDVDSLASKLYEDTVYRIPNIVSTMFFGYNDELEPWPYDPEEAKSLLAQAGYPDGIEISFDSPSGRYPKDTELSEAIANQLAECGINATLRTYEWGTYLEMSRSNSYGHIFLTGSAPAIWDAHNIMEAFSHSQGAISRKYGNSEVDALLDLAKTSLDSNERLQALKEAQELTYNDAAQVWLFELGQIVAIREGIQWEPRPDERLPMINVKVNAD